MDSTDNTQKKTWDWRKRKPNNMLVIKAGPDTGFFKWWCTYMLPMVKMTPKEVDVVASFLKQRWELSKVIADPAIVDSQLMSDTTINKVIEECHITKQHFYVLRSNLKKSKIITDSGINPRLLPSMSKDEDGIFQFLILFKDPNKEKGLDK